MDNLAGVMAKLTEKKKLFLEYENITGNISICDYEEMAACFEKRDALQGKIENIDMEITALCSLAQGGEIMAAYKNECGASAVPPELLPIFTLGQETRAAITRIKRSEPLIEERLKSEKERLEKDIKNIEGNRKVNAFLNNIVEKDNSGIMLNIKK
ncbi:MAG: hypothetical protein RR315_04845 [Oscillospiraceae bacterium]